MDVERRPRTGRGDSFLADDPRVSQGVPAVRVTTDGDLKICGSWKTLESGSYRNIQGVDDAVRRRTPVNASRQIACTLAESKKISTSYFTFDKTRITGGVRVYRHRLIDCTSHFARISSPHCGDVAAKTLDVTMRPVSSTDVIGIGRRISSDEGRTSVGFNRSVKEIESDE